MEIILEKVENLNKFAFRLRMEYLEVCVLDLEANAVIFCLDERRERLIGQHLGQLQTS